MRPFALSLVVLAALACGRRQASPPGPSAAVITGADQLLAAMHQRYAGTWYRTLTFTQRSTYFRPDGTPSRAETWYEALALPARLRIDLGDPSRGNGVMYRSDSVYSVQGGRIVTRQRGHNVLAILGFDVYGQPPAKTLAQLRQERINVAVLRTDTLNGARVYVVGAGPTDFASNQFWVEAERLLFVRLIQSDTAGRRTQDIRFEKYVPHAGGWVAEEVRVLMEGRTVFHEEYSNVRVNVTLDENLFVPEKWSSARHWLKQ